jgi:hypothetical protein
MSRKTIRFSELLRKYMFFFPVRLLAAHLKYNGLLLIFWVVLFMFVLRLWGNDYGVPLLFLDPEYMGEVNFLAYLILGGSCGAFIMAFQIASYIVNSSRFPFLASVSKPFVKYTINNFIIPISFIITYLISNFIFQDKFETSSRADILLNSIGFIIGAGFFYILSLTYFFTVSKDIFRLFGIDILKKEDRKRAHRVQLSGNIWQRISLSRKNVHVMHVETYLSNPVNVMRARETAHYDPAMINQVFRQNHLAAAIFEVAVVSVMIILGLFRDVSFFRIPAAASIFISFTMLLMLASAFHTWLKEWSLLAFTILFITLNWLSGYEFFGKRNQAFGLDYSTKAAIIPDSMLFDRQKRIQVDRDTRLGLESLARWKKRSWKGRNGKPTLIFLNVSGGGLKSAVWTVEALQVADSVTGGHLFRNIRLITGSSGGMIGAAYMRELVLRKELGMLNNIYDSTYTERIGRDLLNPIAYSLAVSDVFLRLQKVKIGNHRYTRDRGYEFERALHENTGFILDKSIKAYQAPEEAALTPMMIFTPSVINDGRRLLISPQPVSYLTYTPAKTGTVLRSLPEDIEFSRFFKEQGADNLRFSSAIRMNATFPYILPSVSLPSNPILEVMDAGFRDNYGLRTSIRYLYHFRNWIANNTDRVIFLQIRENHKAYDLKTQGKSTITELLMSPLGNVYENLFRIQDYQHDQLLMYADEWFKGKLEFIELDLNPPSQPGDEVISMNFHLTSLEKKRIHQAIGLPENKAAIARLKRQLQQ